MLESLYIKDYAIIDELSLDFSDGLNILTGETGAGKSILIGALSFVLGARASVGNIRDGAIKMQVEAVFSLTQPSQAYDMLEGMGIEADESKAILRRELTSSSKSTARVNGFMITSAALKQLSVALLDICGQNESHSLLDPKEHLRFLDGYCSDEISPIKPQLAASYARISEKAKKLRQLQSEDSLSKERIKYAQEALNEIEPMALVPGEYERLEKRLIALSNSQKIFEAVDTALAGIYFSESSALTLVSRALSEIEKAAEYDEGLADTAKLLESIQIDVSEASLTLRDFLASQNSDPRELEFVQNRLSRIRSFMLKYAETVEGIIEYADECRAIISQSVNMPSLIKECKAELEAERQQYYDLAKQASGVRKAASERLAGEIAGSLGELGMPNAVFSVDLDASPPSPNGMDGASFSFSANAGSEPRPLAKVASGGELSRILLAIKNAYADEQGPDSLVFDEIDTGISGRAAQLVAEKMARLSRKRQVLAVTHLTQIAAMADKHMLIQKREHDGASYTKIIELSAGDRASELARMASGAKLTQTSLDHASEVLQMADDYKQSLC
ncbi:MAG: DNA repair protein RecN [Eubacteriaceae bacterium]|nr:DNA repair protein RecN [Eubacteriaceae bacterium]